MLAQSTIPTLILVALNPFPSFSSPCLWWRISLCELEATPESSSIQPFERGCWHRRSGTASVMLPRHASQWPFMNVWIGLKLNFSKFYKNKDFEIEALIPNLEKDMSHERLGFQNALPFLLLLLKSMSKVFSKSDVNTKQSDSMWGGHLKSTPDRLLAMQHTLCALWLRGVISPNKAKGYLNIDTAESCFLVSLPFGGFCS